jgi:uncharacterized hydrophobic protein (TIGR00271 family)
MPRNSTAHMRDAVFFDGPEASAKQSRFWMLLVLASVIAAAGVMGDSTATVIGAMIVAPLMTPILGVMLAVVLGDRANLARCGLLVVAGAVAAVAVGYGLGLFYPEPVVAATNSQVAARVSPHLIDLVAALATGAVGSVALVRSDISDTLPGVAIAISLVPPLSVVGLTLESGAPGEARGALLLFLANVTAILTSGIVVMAAYRVYATAAGEQPREAAGMHRRRAIVLIFVSLVVIAVPLAVASVKAVKTANVEADARSAATKWALGVGWRVVQVATTNDRVEIHIEGPNPIPDTATLRADLADAGVDPRQIDVDLIPVRRVSFANP